MTFSFRVSRFALLALAGLPYIPSAGRAPVAARAALSEPAISPDHREIAFVAGGDIWTVPAAGGEARLLVSHPAYDSRPLYSPDGTRLAFMSTRTGNGDIYLLTLATGQLRRLTFDDVPGAARRVVARRPLDLLLVAARKDVNGMNDIFRVSADGGTPMAVSADRFMQEYWSAPSPTDPNTHRVHREGPNRAAIGGAKATATSTRVRSGSRASAAATPQYEQITKDDAKNAWPMWSGDGKTLYYMSDQSGAENSGASRSPAATREQLTSFKNGRLCGRRSRTTERRSSSSATSACGRSTSRTGKAHEVPITLRGASASPATEHQTLTHGLPVARALARRQEDRVHRARRRVRRLGARRRRRGARHEHAGARGAARLGAGQPPASRTSRAATGRRTSTLRLRARAPRRSSPTARRTTSRRPGRPTASTIAFMRGAKELRVVDVATKQDRVLATGELDRPPFLPERAIAWSPDGHWIAYLTGGDGRDSRILMSWRSSGGRRAPVELPRRTGTAASIAWSPDGTYLLFDTSQRTEDAQIARVDLVPRTPRFREDQFRDLFTAADAPGNADASRRRARRRRSATARPCARDSARARAAARREIVFDDIRRRISVLPVGVDARSVVDQPRRQDGAAQRRRRRVSRISTPSRSTSCRAQPAGRAPAHVDAGLQGERAVHRPTANEVYYIENGRISAINVESRQARADQRHARSWTSISRARSSRCSTRRGAFSPTTSSTRR